MHCPADVIDLSFMEPLLVSPNKPCEADAMDLPDRLPFPCLLLMSRNARANR
jgi:hypothetical protein